MSSKLINGMNNPELKLAAEFPMLRRIPSQQKPYEITINLPVNHNPDFAIFDPQQGRGIWVEVKGRPRNKMWLPMLKAMPDSMKNIYKVVLVSSNKKERLRLGKSLDAIGIEHNDFTLHHTWVQQAAFLFAQDTVNINDGDKQIVCPKIFSICPSDSQELP